MAEFSKLGYGNYDNIDSAIAQGKLNGKDSVITKDTSELVYLRDDNTKQVIRGRVARFASEALALDALNAAADTYAGQIVMILDESKYVPYVVQDDAENPGKYIVEKSMSTVSTGFVWQEF